MSEQNYKGSIELIAGLTQKNNGDFPLMEASAVAFYEPVEQEDGTSVVQEIRLPEKLKQIGISDKEKTQLIQDSVAAAESALADDLTALDTRITNNTTIIGTNQGNISSLTTQIEEMKAQLGDGNHKDLRVYYDEKESMLYLYDDPDDKLGLIKPDPETGSKGNTVSVTTIVGGGASGPGGSLPYRLTLKKNNDIKTVLNNKTTTIQFIAEMLQIPSASEGGEPFPIDKELTFRLTSTNPNRKDLVTSFTKHTNINESFDITPFLTLGRNEITLFTSYTESISVEGELIPITISSSRSWAIKVVEMYLESAFDDSIAFVDRSVNWTGKAYGDINKTIYYRLNNTDWKTESNIVANGQNVTMSIPFQGHGVHSLEIYLSAEVDGETGPETIYSDKLHYELLFVDSQDSTPILRLKATPSPMQQYTAGVLSYTVYSNVELTKNIILKEGDDNIIFSGEVDNTSKNQPYTFMDFGEKIISLSYNYNGTEYQKVINLVVEASKYQINPITTGLVLDFLPTGRSNAADDYNVFYNNAEKVVDSDAAARLPEITWEFSENFDWNNGGWQIDNEQNTYFCVKAGTHVAINYDPFKDSTIIRDGSGAGSGKEFKLIFKTANVGNPNATFLSCLNEQNVGLQMNAHEAYLNSNEKQIYSPYSEEDIIEFDFNIFPGIDGGTSFLPVGDIIPMTMTYEDGTPFQPSVHTLSTSYEHTSLEPIMIGSPDCDVHIYRMKVYDRYLTDSEVLSNYIADARNGAEMVNRHTRNLIYDAGRLTPNSLAEARPDLKIIKITCPKFTNSKSDFQPMTSVEMIHKNGQRVEDNWIFENCFVVGQGTTSNNYRDAGKNLEFICNFDGKTKNQKVLNSDYFQGDEGKYYSYKTKLTLSPNDPSKRVDNSYDATLEEGTSQGTGKISLTETTYPNNYFNVKVNIASSENANNALQANRYQRYMPYTTPAQKRDARIKTTMDFINCVVFLCETDPSGIEFPPASPITNPQDSDYHFYAIGNIGDSKKTDADRAYDPDDENEFVVEIMDNDKPNAAFPTGFKTAENEFTYPITREQWEATDGYKPVENPVYLLDDNLPIFYELIDGNYVKTEDETIDSSKTYYEVNYVNPAYESLYIDKFRQGQDEIIQDSGWAASYEMRYGDDSDENIAIWNEFYEWLILSSNQDFKAQFSNWFVQNAALYYYLFTERYTMMDNRAKNSFWHWAKFYITEVEAKTLGEKANYYTIDNAAASINNGYRFDFWDYDNDTALGIDNNGQIKFSYGLEDIDKNADGTFVFNAGNSVFFRRIRDNFSSELTTIYGTTTRSEAWDPNHLINEYDNWQGEFPEALWLEDAERKYYRTYRSKVLGLPSLTQDWLADHLVKRMQGRKKYQRRQWERDQADYMDSKYGTARAQNKGLLLRCKTPQNTSVPAKYIWQLQPYKKMYLRAYRGEILQDSIRALDTNKVYNLTGSTTSLEDAQLRIYSANCIQDFGDISTFYAYSVEVSSGTEKVKRFIVGNPTEGYHNDEMRLLEIGTAKILKTLNIQNLRNLTSVALVPNLEYLYAQGAGLTNASFAPGGSIKEAYLPNTVTTLKGYDLHYLNKIEMDGVDNLTSVEIDNCPKIINTEAFKNLIIDATKKKLNNNKSKVRLMNINWEINDASILEALYQCQGVLEDGQSTSPHGILTGYIKLTGEIKDYNLNLYKEAWPDLEIEIDEKLITYQFWVRFYDGSIEQEKGKLLTEFLVDNGTILDRSGIDVETGLPFHYTYDPTIEGNLSGKYIAQPVKPNSKDGQFTYQFFDWTDKNGKSMKGVGNDKYTVSGANIDFYAQYNELKRTYRVEWLDGDNQVVGYLPDQSYGDMVNFENAYDPNYNTPVLVSKIPTKTKQGNTYYLFKGWQTKSKVLPELNQDGTDYKDIITILPIFEAADAATVKNKISRPSSPTDRTGNETLVLTATDLYAVAQNGTANSTEMVTTVFDKNSVALDKIQIQLGYMPTFENITEQIIVGSVDSLTKAIKLELDGTKPVTVPALRPFAEGKDFTLALDFTAKYNSKNSGTSYLVSNFSESEAYGFTIACNNTTSPRFSWGSAAAQIGDFAQYIPIGNEAKVPKAAAVNVLDPTINYREICVIRKVGSKIYLYTNDRYTLEEVQMKEFNRITSNKQINTYLTFGGMLGVDGIPTGLAMGTIHYAKIWWDDLGDTECKKICTWPYEKMNFIYSNNYTDNTYYPRYQYQNNLRCQASFIAENLLPELMTYHKDTIPHGLEILNYHETSLKQWLNTKFFKAFPIDWQQTINPVKIPAAGVTKYYSDGGGYYKVDMNEVQSEYDKLYIPSVMEVSSGYSETYGIEQTQSGDIISYPQFISAETRQYELPNTGGAPAHWALRSIYGSSNMSEFYGVTQEGNLSNRQTYTSQGNSQTMRFYPNNKFGVLIGFSI